MVRSQKVDLCLRYPKITSEHRNYQVETIPNVGLELWNWPSDTSRLSHWTMYGSVFWRKTLVSGTFSNSGFTSRIPLKSPPNTENHYQKRTLVLGWNCEIDHQRPIKPLFGRKIPISTSQNPNLDTSEFDVFYLKFSHFWCLEECLGLCTHYKHFTEKVLGYRKCLFHTSKTVLTWDFLNLEICQGNWY